MKKHLLIVFIALFLSSAIALGAEGNPYEILGIQPTTNTKVIKKAYKRKAMKLHPDRSKTPDTEERFKEVKNAYERVLAAAEAGRIIDDNASSEKMTRNQLQAEIDKKLSSNHSSDHIQAVVLLQEYVESGNGDWHRNVNIFERAGVYIENLLGIYKDRLIETRLSQEVINFFEVAAGPMYHFTDSADYLDQRNLFLKLEARFIFKLVIQKNLLTSQFIDDLPRSADGLPKRSISYLAYRFLTDGAILRDEIHDFRSYMDFEEEIKRIRGSGTTHPLLTDLHLFPDIAENIMMTADTAEKIKLLAQRFGTSRVPLPLKRRLMEIAIEKGFTTNSRDFIEILDNLIGTNPRQPSQLLRLELISEFRKTDQPSKNWDLYFYQQIEWNKVMPLYKRIWLKKAPLNMLKPFVFHGPLEKIEREVAYKRLKELSETRWTRPFSATERKTDSPLTISSKQKKTPDRDPTHSTTKNSCLQLFGS